MKTNINCGLRGSYKVDVYSGKKLVETTDWFSNNITNTGLFYPFVYPFARCFMFLSLGSNVPAIGLQNATGFDAGQGINTFNVLDTNINSFYHQSGMYLGADHYETANSCGTTFTASGINMYRGWNIPSGDNNVVGTDLTINAFMTSPSSGSDPTGASAFSMVNRSITINSGYSAVVYYQLTLNFSDYNNPTFFNSGRFDASKASSGIGNSETGLLSGWTQLSGLFRQVFPGIQMVDNYGACVAPRGAQLEPSLKVSPNTYFYLSPDTTQFAVSDYAHSGITESGAYNSSGLMANYGSWAVKLNDGLFIDNKYSSPGSSVTETSDDDLPLAEYPFDIRLGGAGGREINLLSNTNYTGILPSFSYYSKNVVNARLADVSFATPGYVGFDDVNYLNYGQRAIFSSYLKRNPIDTGMYQTGALLPDNATPNPWQRVKKSTRFARISPIQSLGFNSRYGSMVLAYLPNPPSVSLAGGTAYVDYLFFDSSGRSARTPHYRLIPDVYFVERGSGVSNGFVTITGNGVDYSPNSPIQRINGLRLCMGPGVATSTNSSGINIDSSWHFNQNNNYAGYGGRSVLCPGTNVPSNCQGRSDTNANYNNTYTADVGWGAVYGFLYNYPAASTYALPMDTCLIDVPAQGNFVSDNGGNIPNPTGDYSKLCWPFPGSPINLQVLVTGMSYFSPLFNTNIQDPNDLVQNNGYQYFSDIISGGNSVSGAYQSFSSLRFFGQGTYSGAWIDISLNNNPVNSYTISASSSPALTGLSLLPSDINNFIYSTGSYIGSQTGIYSGFYSGKYSDYSTGIHTGIYSGTYVATGFYTGIYTGLYVGIYTGFYTGTYTGLYSGTHTGHGTYTGSYTGLFTGNPIFDSGMYLSATQWKKPSGMIHHVESCNYYYRNDYSIMSTGCRLLPNYASGNNTGTNHYDPMRGGSYPGMSMENGMELFFDLTWSGL